MPPPEGKYYWLTEADRKLLDTLAEERRKTVRGPRYEAPEPQVYQAPETYVARTPTGGIPALTEVDGDDSEDIPGSAECRIYQVIRDYEGQQPRLVYLPDEDRVVFNVNLEPIGANRWIVVTRHKMGHWLALAIFPSPSDDDPYVGVDPIYGDTGTGTNPEAGGASGLWTGYPGYFACSPVVITETDVFCEPGSYTVLHTLGHGLGTGTGTGTDVVLTNYYLNLYKRSVLMGFNRFTGCLESVPLDWEYVRTVGCCEPECVHPDTGTGVVENNCCSGGSLHDSVDYVISGPMTFICGYCELSGTLFIVEEGQQLWTNSTGGSTCGGRVFALVSLYCSGTSYRASIKIRRYEPFTFDSTQSFDIALTDVDVVGVPTLIGTFRLSGCSSDISIAIEHPCYSYDCSDGNCVEAPRLSGQYGTIEECQADCVETVPGGGAGAISVGCCPSNLLPTTMTLTFSNGSGAIACLDGKSYTLTWDGIDAWTNTSSPVGCGSDTFSVMEFRCTGANWSILLSGCIDLLDGPDSSSCDPILFQAIGQIISSGLCGTGTIDWAVTE